MTSLSVLIEPGAVEVRSGINQPCLRIQAEFEHRPALRASPEPVGERRRPWMASGPRLGDVAPTGRQRGGFRSCYTNFPMIVGGEGFCFVNGLGLEWSNPLSGCSSCWGVNNPYAWRV